MMTTFNKDELLKIAKLSALNLSDDDIELFTHQIKNVLTFVDQLQQVPASHQAISPVNINVFREDVAVQPTTIAPLEQAPDRQGNYFVVPKILDEK